MSLLGRILGDGPSNKTPVPHTSRRASGGDIFAAPVKAGADPVASMTAYGSVPTLFAVVSRLANDVAGVEWKLYRKSTDRRRRYASEGMDDRVEVTVHAALALLNKPNPFMTRQELFETVQQHIDLTGEGWLTYAHNDKFPGLGPIELWPMRPDRVQIVTDAENFVSGYVYKTPDGDKVPLDVNDVMQIRMPNPLDVHRGLSPVSALMVDLDSARYAAEYNRNFFKNSAMPGGLIEVPEGMEDEDFRRLVMRWRETHQGVTNAHRISVLDNGAKWVNPGYSMKDMEFSTLRNVSDSMILKAFGFPKFMLGEIDDVNRATAEAADLMYFRHCLKPRLERLKQALNNDLLPMFGPTAAGLEFDYDAEEPTDEDAEAARLKLRADALKTLVDAGFDAVGATEVVGLPPMGYEKPTPAPLAAPQATPDTEADPDADAAPVAVLNAQRWVVKAEMDKDTCGPCKANNGRTYKNRADAYSDYPGGDGYTKCVGAKFGNGCRCRVVKRGGSE